MSDIPFLIVFGAALLFLLWDMGHTRHRLNKLRRNCFLTNERGHRVKYWNASESVRERAEG